jgi:hypothetical protein
MDILERLVASFTEAGMESSRWKWALIGMCGWTILVAVVVCAVPFLWTVGLLGDAPSLDTQADTEALAEVWMWVIICGLLPALALFALPPWVVAFVLLARRPS